MQTVIRAVETFLAVFFSAFFAQITVEGTPLDITSNDGRSRLVTAAVAAILLAARQWVAVREKND